MKKRNQIQDLNNNYVDNSQVHQLKEFKRFGFQRFIGEVIIPICLIIIIPLSTMILWHICRHFSGSISDFIASKTTLYEITLGQWKNSLFAFYVIMGYMLWAIPLSLLLPGETYNGPITNKGNTPIYVNNGFKFYIITLISFITLSIFLEYIGYSVTIICDRYVEFVLTLNVISLSRLMPAITRSVVF